MSEDSDIQTEAIKAGISAGTKFLSGLFKSKKHYQLYYWDQAQSSWVWVREDHKDPLNKLAASYAQSGVPTSIVKDIQHAPKTPPAGVSSSSGRSGLNPWILAGIAGAGVIAFFLLRGRVKS